MRIAGISVYFFHRQGRHAIISHHNFPGGKDEEHRRRRLGAGRGLSGTDKGSAVDGIRKYPTQTVDIIVIAFTAVLCGYEDYGEMEEFGRLRQDLLKGFLELPGGNTGRVGVSADIAMSEPAGTVERTGELARGHKDAGERGGRNGTAGWTLPVG
jgi:hypothetical protein